MADIILIAEDAPLEAMAVRILQFVDGTSTMTTRIPGRGIGNVSRRLPELNRAARHLKILALVDRDSPANCPIEMIDTWLGVPRNSGLLVRFAEMEAESWILADRVAIAEELVVSSARTPEDPDQLPDPKRTLVNIARHSRSRDVRSDIVPRDGSSVAVGPAYNARLTDFIARVWNPERAVGQSPSLAKAVLRLSELLLT